MKTGRLIHIFLLVLFIGLISRVYSQGRGLVSTSESAWAELAPVGITDHVWTGGFWAHWYGTCREVMVPHMMGNYMDDSISHAWANFRIAAGLQEGKHSGPPFHDGDFYKIMEAMIMVNALERDPETESFLDSLVAVIGSTQREDGYIHTPVVIEQYTHGSGATEFRERLDFETYNMGHLMTAACLHHRSTGKENLLDIARGATDFLYAYYRQNPDELAQNAICPSHYMGVTEMYRTTGESRYLELAKGLIDIRSRVEDGTDHNQDRIPFREQRKAIGHAVRANYLYAGAADVLAETGDSSLQVALEAIWQDLNQRKLYITGGCGALYDGVSPNGTTYDQGSIQQVHQAYGQDYELPNTDAHNESCANIGLMLWDWRMFLQSGEGPYMDQLEKVAYNVLLAGVSLDGRGYFYTNPLGVDRDQTYELRWSKVREPYISYCNCCPPNTIRTVAEMSNYAYSLTPAGIRVNLYGAGRLETLLVEGVEDRGAGKLALVQETDYPWDGRINLHLEDCPRKDFSIGLRIPAWSRRYEISVNGEALSGLQPVDGYVEISRKWKKGDELLVELGMEAFLVEANPLVEDTRNLVAVQRGPVVYCLESAGLPEGVDLEQVLVPARGTFSPVEMKIGDHPFIGLETDAVLRKNIDWDTELYRPLQDTATGDIAITLIPYYAWGNRGEGDMAVWLPLTFYTGSPE